MLEGTQQTHEDIIGNEASEETLLSVTFIGRLAPPPSNDSQAPEKVAIQDPTESKPTESESDLKEAEGPHNLNNNKPVAPNRIIN